MKRFSWMCLMCALAVAGSAQALLKINDQTYTEEDQARFGRWTRLTSLPNFERKRGSDRTRQVQKLLDVEQQSFTTYVALLQDAKANKVEVLPEDIDKQKTALSERLKKVGPLEELALEAEITPEELQSLFSDQALIDKRLSKVIEPELVMTEEELKKVYQSDKENVFRTSEQVRLQYIMAKIESDSDEASVTEARRKAERLRSQVTLEGQPFDVLLPESDDPKSTDPQQPNLFIKGMLSYLFGDEVEKTAFELKEGDISEPIRGTGGFYVLYILEHKIPTFPPFETVKTDLEQRAIALKRLRLLAQYREKMRTEAKVEVLTPPGGTSNANP